MRPASHTDIRARLDALGMFHMDLTPDRMKRGLRALGLVRPPFAIAQIVGTNGKGSTASMLASLAEAHGVKTGLFTSPHMLSPRERILINGEMLPEANWNAFVGRALAAEAEATYFECLCLAATLAFAELGVELAVMEAGLGGRHDATTALPADLVCFTPIDRDHTNVLGDSLHAVASDKAAAVRKNASALTAGQKPEALDCLARACRRLDVPLLHAADLCALPQRLVMRLRGPHQLENARNALAAWLETARRLGRPVREEAVRRGLENACIPGRLQAIAPNGTYPHLLLDGAHNAHALIALRGALADLRITPAAVIFSCLQDKEPETAAPLVRDLAPDAPLLVPPIADNPRAAPPAALAALLGPSARTAPSLAAALADVASAQTTPSSPVLICGSLYLLAEFFRLFPTHLTRSAPLPGTP